MTVKLRVARARRLTHMRLSKTNERYLSFAVVPIGSLLIISWLYGLYTALQNGSYLLFAVDFAIPPIGIIHGVGAFFDWW